jgi:L-threonylcarbamoyladenylate synthase
MHFRDEKLKSILKEGGVAVMPTDTIYGLVGRADRQDTVERIYEIKKRAPAKPCIILISDQKDLEKFSVFLSNAQREEIKEYWFTLSGVEGPSASAQDLRPTSIIFDCQDDKLEYLHRGTNTLAFRMPKEEKLRELLSETGPLVAPSANPEGLPPAKNILEAKNYFGELIDLYVDGGEASGAPSKIIKLHKDGTVSILRE